MSKLNTSNSAEQLIAAINRYHEGDADQVTAPGTQDVFIGYLAKNGLWVQQKDIGCVVDYGITYTFRLPDDIIARVSYGATYQLGTQSAYMHDGDTLTLPTTAVAQRIAFARYVDGAVADLSLADAQGLLETGSIRVTYMDDDVVTHNMDRQCMLAALTKSTYNENKDASSPYYYQKLPLIAHTSDLHGDMQRMWNMCLFAKRFGIDECVVSGDAVLYTKDDGNSYVFAAAEQAGVHVLLSTGNHEAYPQAGASYISETINYERFLTGHAADLGYLIGSGRITDRAYYYYDLAAKKIRFIVLDQYDGGVYGGQNKAGRISQAQIDFFIAALKSAPAGYGIVVVMHSPEKAITVPNGFEKFNTTTPKSGNNGDNYSYAANGAYNDASRPISQIIDAFISRATYTGSWSTTYRGASETIAFTADFTSGVNDDVEFVCYLNGHIHTDTIGYLSGTSQRQLNINITAGNGHVTADKDYNYGFSGVDDLPRRGTGATQDAFNVYAIDRANKQVRILRIGSNVKKDFSLRDWLIVDY